MPEVDVALPSIRHIHQIIRHQREQDTNPVEVKLLTGDVIIGNLKWIDQHCICIDGSQSGKSHPFLIWHHAIAYIKS